MDAPGLRPQLRAAAHAGVNTVSEHPERQAFEDAINADPLDMTTRKVFADWLDDHDEPELADYHRTLTVGGYTEARGWVAVFAKGMVSDWDEDQQDGKT